MITVISAITMVVGIAVGLLNKRIDDTNRHIDELKQEMDRGFDELGRELKEEIREIRILLYKVFEVPNKGEKT